MFLKVIKFVYVYIFQSECVYLYLCHNGAFSVFPSSQLFSVSRSSQNIESVLSEREVLQQKFKDLPGSSLEKLKKLHSEVFSKVNWGRLVVFLNFADQLALTEKEWELLLHFLFLTLTQIRE